VHLYLTQSFQKFDAENFLRNTVVQPPNRLNHKTQVFRFNNHLNIPVGDANPTTCKTSSRLNKAMVFVEKKRTE
jgi:hypothetical protein